MSRAELTCRDLVELVTEYEEGALSAGDRARFETHLAECPYCALFLEQMRAAARAAGGLPEPALSEAVVRRLLRIFGTWKAGPR
jgi:anti-sigma factor RsiW